MADASTTSYSMIVFSLYIMIVAVSADVFKSMFKQPLSKTPLGGVTRENGRNIIDGRPDIVFVKTTGLDSGSAYEDKLVKIRQAREIVDFSLIVIKIGCYLHYYGTHSFIVSHCGFGLW